MSTVKMLFCQPLTIPERCFMSTQSSPAASLRTINRFPAAGVLLRVASYLIYKALSPILPTISGAASVFLPAFPVRQGKSRHSDVCGGLPLCGLERRVFVDRIVEPGAEKTRQRLLD